MLDLKNPFVMPENVMLRTDGSSGAPIGGCHMAIPDTSAKQSPLIGGCHMCDGSGFAPEYATASIHREVAVLN